MCVFHAPLLREVIKYDDYDDDQGQNLTCGSKTMIYTHMCLISSGTVYFVVDPSVLKKTNVDFITSILNILCRDGAT